MRRKRILAVLLCVLLLAASAPAANLAGFGDWLNVRASDGQINYINYPVFTYENGVVTIFVESLPMVGFTIAVPGSICFDDQGTVSSYEKADKPWGHSEILPDHLYLMPTDWWDISGVTEDKRIKIINENWTYFQFGQLAFPSPVQSVIIDQRITRIDAYVFCDFGLDSDCENTITSFSVNSSNPFYCSDKDGVILTKDQTEIIRIPPAYSSSVPYVISDTVTRIGDYAFCQCEGLSSVMIPYGVTSIGEAAFYDCSNLTSVTIPDSVVSIGRDAFLGNSSLISLTIPDSVTDIGTDAFFDVCNIVYHGSASGSPWGAKSVNGFEDGGLFYDSDAKQTLRACSCMVQGLITIPNSVTSIGENAFSGCKSLTGITIPSSVTSIGENAFSGCKSLTSITIPESVIEIGDWAFYGCTELTNVAIPNSVTSIGRTFGGCTKLTSVHMSSQVTELDDFIFYGCDNLEYICSDTEDCYAKTFAEENGIEFRVCKGHETVCEHDYTSAVTTEPTCAAAGVRTYTCTICGDSYTEDIAKLAHTPEDVTEPATCTADGRQYTKCSVCGETLSEAVEIPAPGHAYDSAVTTEPTCTAEGVRTFTCTRCGDSYAEAIEKKPHTEKQVRIEPTCTAVGSVYMVCAVCGEPLSEAQELTALGHAYNAVVTKEPTCSAEGVTTYTCARCGDSYTENIDKIAHTPQEVTEPATCTADGKQYTKCSVCGETLGEITVLPMIAHSFGAWVTVTEPTTEAEGLQERACIYGCGTKETQVLPKIPTKTVKDTGSGISLTYPETAFEDDAELQVEQVFDGAAFNLVDLNSDKNAVFDITMVKDGAAVQPNGKVTVRIPVPSGFDGAKCMVYHVNTETGKLEKMNARYENGFMVFETDHFSYYAIVIEKPIPPTVAIRNYTQSKTVDYRTTITFTAEVTNPVSGAAVHWFINGQDKGAADTYTEKEAKATYTVQTKYIKDGTVLAESETETVNVKTGFFAKLKAFFRALFGRLPKQVQEAYDLDLLLKLLP